jgi:hypothetical protein
LKHTSGEVEVRELCPHNCSQATFSVAPVPVEHCSPPVGSSQWPDCTLSPLQYDPLRQPRGVGILKKAAGHKGVDRLVTQSLAILRIHPLDTPTSRRG